MTSITLRRSACILLLSLLLAACGGKSSVREPTPLQDIDAPRVNPSKAWTASGGNGMQREAIGLRLAVADGVVYVANQGGQVAAFDSASGKQIWRNKLDQRLLSGPGLADDMLLVGSRDGALLALSKNAGELLWKTGVGSEIIAAPAAANDIAVARTIDGRVASFDLDSGDRLWTIEHSVPTLTTRGAAPPLIVGGRVYAGLDNGEVVALDLATGQYFWEQVIALPTGRSDLDRMVDVDADLQIDDNTLYAASIGGKLAALTLGNGQVRWKQSIASTTGVALDQQHVFVTDLDGIVHAVSRASGAPVWTQDALKYRQLSAPVMYNGYLVVGDYEGYLHWLDPQTGDLVGRMHVLDSQILAPPVVAGGQLLVLGVDGRLAAVRE